MGVIQYRRGERFDRVIISKNEDHRPTTMVVRLNTHAGNANVMTAASTSTPSSTPSPFGTRGPTSLKEILRGAIAEAEANRDDPAAARERIKSIAMNAMNKSQSADTTTGTGSNPIQRAFGHPIRLFIFALIAIQILRAMFGS